MEVRRNPPLSEAAGHCWVWAPTSLMVPVARHSAKAHHLSVPCGYLSFFIIFVFQEGPVPIWTCMKKRRDLDFLWEVQ